MTKRTKRAVMSVLRTPGAVALICVVAVCVTAIFLYLPPEERAAIGAPGGVLATLVALFIRLRSEDREEDRPTVPPPEGP